MRAREPMHVLVVEDEARYRAFLLGVLADMECAPRGAATAAEAQRMAAEASPDVVLLDLNLPVMDGLTFLGRFRITHPDTPVIILTGVGDLQSAQEASRLGVTEFLTKPCHLGEIEAALGRARRQVPEAVAVSDREPASPPPVSPAANRPIVELERDAIFAALARNGGNRSAAAIELGISRRTLYSRLQRYRADGVVTP